VQKKKLRKFASAAFSILRDAAGSSGQLRFCWLFRLAALCFLEANHPDSWQVSDDTIRNPGQIPLLFQRLHEEFPLAFPESESELCTEDMPLELFHTIKEIIPLEMWRGNFQLAGWIYQYYIAEEKKLISSDKKRRSKVSGNQIYAVTQVFTPEWLVRYMTENTLGGYCQERKQLHYYVRREKEYTESCSPQDLRVLDPCMGSGNILVSAFDLLMQIYLEHGFSPREAAVSILQNNIYGMDIDPNACRLTAFALYMKLKAVCPAVCCRKIRLQLVHFQFPAAADKLLHASQLGALLPPETAFPAGADSQAESAMRLLSMKYDVVCTNPPYLSNSGMNPVVSAFIREHYADYKADLFAAFIVRCMEFAKQGGKIGMLTPFVWMFIQSYQKLRAHIYDNTTPETLVQLAYSAFRDATVPVCAFTLHNGPSDEKGIFIRLSEFQSSMEIQKGKMQEAARDIHCSWRYEAAVPQLRQLAGQPLVYWLSQQMQDVFERGIPLGRLAEAKQGLATGCNARFLRFWFEVFTPEISRGVSSRQEAKKSGMKWFPYNKGGDYRKWYGNDVYIVDWKNDGAAIRSFYNEKGRKRSRPQNMQYYFQECFSWSLVSSSAAAFRYKPGGMIFDVSGMSCFGTEHREYLLALCNSAPAEELLKAIAPTINYQCGDIAAMPVILPENQKTEERIGEIAEENIALCKEDWDSFEISMDFQGHPLL